MSWAFSTSSATSPTAPAAVTPSSSAAIKRADLLRSPVFEDDPLTVLSKDKRSQSPNNPPNANNAVSAQNKTSKENPSATPKNSSALTAALHSHSFNLSTTSSSSASSAARPMAGILSAATAAVVDPDLIIIDQPTTRPARKSIRPALESDQDNRTPPEAHPSAVATAVAVANAATNAPPAAQTNGSPITVVEETELKTKDSDDPNSVSSENHFESANKVGTNNSLGMSSALYSSSASSSNSSVSAPQFSTQSAPRRVPASSSSSASSNANYRHVNRWSALSARFACPTEVSAALCDDWASHGAIPGEKAVMKVEWVLFVDGEKGASALQTGAAVDTRALVGTLNVTSYQLYFEPYNDIRAPHELAGRLVSPALIATPLANIERMDIENFRNPLRVRLPQLTTNSSHENANANASALSTGNSPNLSASPSASVSSSGLPNSSASPSRCPYLQLQPLLQTLDCSCKDGRFLRFGFTDSETCKRVTDCLQQYVFPGKDEFLFAFYHKLQVPQQYNGWNLYKPLEEYKRMGIPNAFYRISWVNKDYSLAPTYPNVLCVPAESAINDSDLKAIAQFRSMSRIPVLVWKHPQGRQTIWRCSQPKVGVNNQRCLQDEKLFATISELNHRLPLQILDCRPKMNARANILAGKGFESTEYYKNCKIFFMNIQNIHAMRDSLQKLYRACRADVHDGNFIAAVAQSGWLFHISELLKACFQMVTAVDKDKASALSHCSDGWDRTTQLVSLAELCLDPYYRTLDGFIVLIEKEWLSFGHQFHRRTGHGDRNITDDQRAPIFLQFVDCVYQLLLQFPRHFEFNSHFLVTLMDHIYSCRFGTFLFNTEMQRKKKKLDQQTVSLWTYFRCSPAALRGEFINPIYSYERNGADYSEHFATAIQIAQVQTEFAQRMFNESSAQDTNGTAVATANSSSGSATSAAGSIDSLGTRSSVGRGGGDGSSVGSGAVLYPTFSMKRLTLWSDYFLRWYDDQYVHGGLGVGTVPPFGALSSQMHELTIYQQSLRMEQRLVSALSKQVAAQQQLLKRWARERNQFPPPVNSANEKSDEADESKDQNHKFALNAQQATPPALSTAVNPPTVSALSPLGTAATPPPALSSPSVDDDQTLPDVANGDSESQQNEDQLFITASASSSSVTAVPTTSEEYTNGQRRGTGSAEENVSAAAGESDGLTEDDGESETDSTAISAGNIDWSATVLVGQSKALADQLVKDSEDGDASSTSPSSSSSSSSSSINVQDH